MKTYDVAIVKVSPTFTSQPKETIAFSVQANSLKECRDTVFSMYPNAEILYIQGDDGERQVAEDSVANMMAEDWNISDYSHLMNEYRVK